MIFAWLCKLAAIMYEAPCMTTETDISFAELGLSASILTALNDLGYENHHQSNSNVFHC